MNTANIAIAYAVYIAEDGRTVFVEATGDLIQRDTGTAHRKRSF